MYNTLRKNALYICIGILVLGGAYFVAAELLSSTTSFSRSYTTYQSVAQAHDAAAFYPSTNQNPIRRELNTVLGDVLVGTLTPAERIVRAERGLVLIQEAEAQIDIMGDFVPRVEVALDGLRGSGAWFESRKVSNGIDRVIQLGEKRLDLIADIRGFSYRANFYTKEIFRRVIDDKGVVTEEHAALLNEHIPLVEEQFDRRSNLYVELESTGSALDSTAFDILE
jgi:hypothetical protein